MEMSCYGDDGYGPKHIRAYSKHEADLSNSMEMIVQLQRSPWYKFVVSEIIMIVANS